MRDQNPGWNARGGERAVAEYEKTGRAPSRRAGDTLEVAHFWSDQALAIETYPTPQTVTAGADSGDDFIVDESELGEESTPLLRWEEGTYRLVFSAAVEGVVSDGRHEYTVEELVDRGIARRTGPKGRWELPVGARTEARLEIGANTFVVRFVRMPADVGTAGPTVDWEAIPYYGVSTAAHLTLLLLALALPGRVGALERDDLTARERFASTYIKPDRDVSEPAPTGGDGTSENEGAAHDGKEGKSGAEQAEQTGGRLEIEGPPETEQRQVEKATDEAVARDVGVVGAIHGSNVSSLFGEANETVGHGAISALGKLQEGDPGPAAGKRGLGLTGPGEGGGGDDETVGIGEVVPGRGGAPCEPYPECAAAKMGDPSERTPPRIVPGDPGCSGGGSTSGTCPARTKQMIRRVVRRHRRELRYCYEQQLQTRPDLRGRVEVRFTIAPGGGVISATVRDSSVGNPEMEACLLRKIRHWQFPAIEASQVARVNYPFNFTRK